MKIQDIDAARSNEPGGDLTDVGKHHVTSRESESSLCLLQRAGLDVLFVVEAVHAETTTHHGLAGSEDIPRHAEARVEKQKTPIRARERNGWIDLVPKHTGQL